MKVENLTRNQEFLIRMSQLSAQYGTCSRHQVGAVLAMNDVHLVSSGRNGVKSGETHCSELMSSGKLQYSNHREWSKKNEVHAEVNALQQAFENKLLNNANCGEHLSIYVTHSPCSACTDFIISSAKMVNIKSVYFGDVWSNHDKEYLENINKFANAGISVYKIMGMRSAIKVVDGEDKKVLETRTQFY